MIFGMLPLALALGSGAEFRAPMARAIVGGLVTSTLLTLIVVPVVYTILDDLTARLRARRARKGPAHVGATAATLAIALGAATAAAEPPSVRTLSLEEALGIADAHNADVLKARAFRRWVDGKYVEERAAALPSLEVGGSAFRQHDASQRGLYPQEFRDLLPVRYDARGSEVRLSQVLFTWGQVGAAIRAARQGIGYADDQLRRVRQTTVRDVTTAFYDVLAARELQRIAEENLAVRRRHLEEARRRMDLGTATDYDVLSAEVAADNARPEAIRAANQVRQARERLRFLLGDGKDVDAAGTLAVDVEPAPEHEASLRAALLGRPDLAEMAHRRGVARELVTIASAQGRPRLDLSGAWGRRWLDVRDAQTSGGTWTLGLVLKVPVFDGLKTSGRVMQARADLDQVALDEVKLRDAIALEVRTAVDAVQEAGEIVRALSGTVRQAERVLDMAEKGYELGVKTRLDVEDASANLVSAQAGLARAHRDYRVARVNLAWARGEP
jgi:HAE1 family hydrophobic/amphiphilic exporter-1